MNTMPTSERPENPSERRRDDLTALKGIGPSRQQWLREVLEVYTLQDLASLSIEDIEAQVDSEGLIASRSEIVRWIDQARELTAAYPVTMPEDIETTDTPETEAENFPPSPRQPSNWEAFAQFLIYFEERRLLTGAVEQRTKAHHIEKDKEAIWPGVEIEQIKAWMLAQMNGEESHIPEAEAIAESQLSRPAPSPAGAEEAPSLPHVRVRKAMKEWPSVQPTEIRIYQPSGAHSPLGIGRAGQPFGSTLRSNEDFALEVDFELTGSNASEAAFPDTDYSAEFYIQDRANQAKFSLGETGTTSMIAGQLNYTARLTGARLAAGAYRLRVVVKVNNTMPLLGYMEVPLLPVH